MNNDEVLAIDVGSMYFIGNILNWMLMGTLLSQMFTYYQKFARDRISIMILVYTVFCLDIAQTIMLTNHGWWFIITIWGKPEDFDLVPWSAAMIVFMCGLISGIVQLFYAWRIWVLARSKIMVAIAILIVLVSLKNIFVNFSFLLRNPIQQTVLRLHPGFTVWLAGSLATDVLITSCMTYALYTAKTKTAWAASETLLGRMIKITVQTGLATVVTACIDLFLFIHFTTNDFHLVPYSNSLLLSLNQRNSRTDAFPMQPENSLPMHYFRSRVTPSSNSIHVERHTDQRIDDTPESSKTGVWNKGPSADEERQRCMDVVTVDICMKKVAAQSKLNGKAEDASL
ncbi:hypothetical protein C8R44DRAFT_758653 [Mycena epipterygia]|nr:hypothetical protein C8R44DRAFT_758653 [Mycena epipterygia]